MKRRLDILSVVVLLQQSKIIPVQTQNGQTSYEIHSLCISIYNGRFSYYFSTRRHEDFNRSTCLAMPE